MRPIIYPYKMGSKSAKALSDKLSSRGCRRVYPDKKYTLRPNHLVINWGNSTFPAWWSPLHDFHGGILNHPNAVGRAANKLTAFQTMEMEGVSVPEFTTSPEVVYTSLSTKYQIEWFARKKLDAHSGEGIVPIYGGQEYGPEGDIFPSAPLYVRYVKKKHEYRVHVFEGEVIDVQQKKKRTDAEAVDYQIRNVANGWVYCRDNIDVPASVCSESVAAVDALGLDFGAVDVIWNEKQQQAYVLEVNTAPGLEGTTLERYQEALEALL